MIDVTCAIIRNEEDEVLIVQRGEGTDHPYKWEFPGGKVASGETEEDCIIREIKEELSIDIVISGRLPVVIHDYGHKKIRLIPFICDTLDDFPFLSEHLDFKWIVIGELNETDFSEADISVARDYIAKYGANQPVSEIKGSKTLEETSDDSDMLEMLNRISSTTEAEWIAASAMDNKTILEKLIEHSFSENKKLGFHSSWTLSKACDKYPGIIYPYLDSIVSRLDSMENEAAQRSFLRIISLSDITVIGLKSHGILAEHCFKALRSGFSAIAIKAYSMEILYNLAKIYPELANELAATINMLQGEGSAGIVARGRLILKKLS